MAKKDNVSVSWFVQSYYKPYVATAILTNPIIDQTKNSMTLCKVLLHNLKPSDINYSSNDKISEEPLEHQRQQLLFATSSNDYLEATSSSSSSEMDYLKLQIKPITTAPRNSRCSLISDTSHESSPIRVVIRETSRGRHRICVSQTLLRIHHSDV